MLDRLRKSIRQNPTVIARRLSLAILVSTGVVGAWVGHLNMIHPRTNDAMVRANTVDIVIQHVSGRIASLGISDNQFVHQGDLLYAIDARPYEAALQQAEAELHVAEQEVTGQLAGVQGAEAHIRESQNTLKAQEAEVTRLAAKAEYALSYLKRIQPLEPEAFVTHNQVRQADADWRAAEAAVRDAQAKVAAARETLEVSNQSRNTAMAKLAINGNAYARIQSAEAKVRQAQLNVEYCTVRAPFDGWVTNLNTQVGQYVAEGQKLFALVDDTTWYVMADYKETYLRYIRPGLPVDVFLASYPGLHFKGEVQGIAWANYPDNVTVKDGLPQVQRTLNWVMLAARFPVRIKLIDRDPGHPFRMGMSAFTTIGIAP